MTRRFVHMALMGMLMLVAVSSAMAQQVPQPVVRMGNWLEVGK